MIEEHLKEIAEYMIKQHVPCGAMDRFLAEHGRRFKDIRQTLPDEVPEGEPRACYQNAATIATRMGAYTYCEGYAAGIIPLPHAWLMDTEGRVVDPTWTGGRDRASVGWEYFGIAIKTKFLIRHLLLTKKYSPVLGDWQHGCPILHAKTTDWKA